MCNIWPIRKGDERGCRKRRGGRETKTGWWYIESDCDKDEKNLCIHLLFHTLLHNRSIHLMVQPLTVHFHALLPNRSFHLTVHSPIVLFHALINNRSFHLVVHSSTVLFHVLLYNRSSLFMVQSSTVPFHDSLQNCS